MSADRDHLRALVEAVLYLSPEPLPLKQLARATRQPPELIQELLASLMAEYDRPDRGVRLRILAGGYTISTKPELGAELKQVLAGLRPPKPLSKQAVETAAVVAMLQPVTAHEIQTARKVRNTDAIRTLLRRKLIAPAGRARGRGKPLQYEPRPSFSSSLASRTSPNCLQSKRFSRSPASRLTPILRPADGRIKPCISPQRIARSGAVARSFAAVATIPNESHLALKFTSADPASTGLPTVMP